MVGKGLLRRAAREDSRHSATEPPETALLTLPSRLDKACWLAVSQQPSDLL